MVCLFLPCCTTFHRRTLAIALEETEAEKDPVFKQLLLLQSQQFTDAIPSEAISRSDLKTIRLVIRPQFLVETLQTARLYRSNFCTKNP